MLEVRIVLEVTELNTLIDIEPTCTSETSEKNNASVPVFEIEVYGNVLISMTPLLSCLVDTVLVSRNQY